MKFYTSTLNCLVSRKALGTERVNAFVRLNILFIAFNPIAIETTYLLCFLSDKKKYFVTVILKLRNK